MPSEAPRLMFRCRPMLLTGMTTLLIALAALPIAAQNAVPATAVEAARKPQFASRLAHPANGPASRPSPALTRQLSRRGPGQGGVMYDNGPINGNTDAWAINSGFVVADSFLANGSPLAGISFGAWLFPGDVLQSVDVSITSEPFGGTTLFSGTVNLTQSGCVDNGFGLDVCTETGLFTGPTLPSGTYWVNLQNAVTPSGDPVYWDENSGPSMAEQNSVGTIPSEAFSILAGTTTTCLSQQAPVAEPKAITVPRSPTQSYRVIYNFTGGADGGEPSTGLVIDAAGNLYGTASQGGSSGGGTVFKLTPGDSGWSFSRLYSFSGAHGSQPNATLVRSTDGRLHGTTAGGGLGNGVLFGLSPAGNILPTPFSNWRESLLYEFTGGNDGASPSGSIVLDSSGNIFGSTLTGGANGRGTLYEFTNGGIQVLHSFPAFPGDGIDPIGVVKNADGLYGITSGGGANGLGTLYTTAGGYQVLYSFGSYPNIGSPVDLAAGQMGNLYATDSWGNDCGQGGGDVYQFSPPDWTPSTLFGIYGNGAAWFWVSTDALGNVYGTVNFFYFPSSVFELSCCWNYTDLHDFAGGPNDGASPMAAPIVDARGNIYGTTQSGGLYGNGVVWEISP